MTSKEKRPCEDREQKKLELDEMDAHCIARMLQSYLFTDTPFAGCRFCKYNCFNDDAKPTNDKRIRKLLMDFTGVDLGPAVYGYLEVGGFPYKKFLKNSSNRAKEYFRNFFKDI